jgi:hypothetical protein
MTGIFWLYTTARLAMVLYFATLGLRLSTDAADRRRRWARCTWAAACVLYDVHVLLAFQYVYHWSHATAVEFTAKRTAEVLGTPSGNGIFVSYAFTLVWTADVLWQWLAPTSHAARPRIVGRLVEGFAAFMVFNAVILFAEPKVRWCGLAAIGLLLVSAVMRRKAIRPDPKGPAI